MCKCCVCVLCMCDVCMNVCGVLVCLCVLYECVCYVCVLHVCVLCMHIHDLCVLYVLWRQYSCSNQNRENIMLKSRTKSLHDLLLRETGKVQLVQNREKGKGLVRLMIWNMPRGISLILSKAIYLKKLGKDFSKGQVFSKIKLDTVERLIWNDERKSNKSRGSRGKQFNPVPNIFPTCISTYPSNKRVFAALKRLPIIEGDKPMS